ncbi:DUF721 domain-containing protein [Pontibacter sp. HSC-36F09]|uniref:DUF721 domain-containing protein n=1 Tax=Pontibacter sp. HSC-36F09 TaxID=2910966 RepID=UPI00209C8E03|nr:DUF721 domain-containing protein [Pontibacter sp. HSC-36F09]MCP2042946.1 putative nucleic acid-binding Zn ribbon protein [Pontibacter sp. HSC-36F09]
MLLLKPTRSFKNQPPVRYYKKKEEIAKRKADVQTIGDSIKGLLKAYRLQGKLNEVDLVQRWEEIMGKPIAMKTKELYFRDQKLFVRLTSAPLKHELNMSKSKVVELLNRAMGDEVVKEVVFL